MNDKQLNAISCAYYDLLGVLQAHQQGMLDQQDWKAVWFSIMDLHDNFKDTFKDDELTAPHHVVTKPE